MARCSKSHSVIGSLTLVFVLCDCLRVLSPTFLRTSGACYCSTTLGEIQAGEAIPYVSLRTWTTNQFTTILRKVFNPAYLTASRILTNGASTSCSLLCRRSFWSWLRPLKDVGDLKGSRGSDGPFLLPPITRVGTMNSFWGRATRVSWWSYFKFDEWIANLLFIFIVVEDAKFFRTTGC